MADYIRYVKLTFTIQFMNDANVPAFKCSTLRGGLGDMLMAQHCIRDGNCEECSFADACVVRSIYYHRLKIQPVSVNDGGSLGYTFECPSERTHVREGDTMKFSLLLYGDVIVYFSIILDGLYRLGMNGIGQKKQAHFQITCIEDQDHNQLFSRGQVKPGAMHVRNLMQDAEQKAARSTPDLFLDFKTPWTQKWKNEFLDHFELEAFAASVYRRVYLMHCMEGIDYPDRRDFMLDQVRVETFRTRSVQKARYSDRQGSKIYLHGIEGIVFLENLPEDLRVCIYAGEIVHIGKNTSMGFGKYTVTEADH